MGLLSTLITFLPPPYSTLVSTTLKYYSLLDSFLDDLFLLVFALGWLVVWGEWRSGRSGPPETFAWPREGE